MLQVTCTCGKVAHGTEAMAGQAAQCMKCRKMLLFPAPRRSAPVPVAAGVERFASALLDAPFDAEGQKEKANPAPAAQEQAAPATAS